MHHGGDSLLAKLTHCPVEGSASKAEQAPSEIAVESITGSLHPYEESGRGEGDSTAESQAPSSSTSTLDLDDQPSGAASQRLSEWSLGEEGDYEEDGNFGNEYMTDTQKQAKADADFVLLDRPGEM